MPELRPLATAASATNYKLSEVIAWAQPMS
jgi:hypothetical protein